VALASTASKSLCTHFNQIYTTSVSTRAGDSKALFGKSSFFEVDLDSPESYGWREKRFGQDLTGCFALFLFTFSVPFLSLVTDSRWVGIFDIED
jgi:hypothetical protein